MRGLISVVISARLARLRSSKDRRRFADPDAGLLGGFEPAVVFYLRFGIAPKIELLFPKVAYLDAQAACRRLNGPVVPTSDLILLNRALPLAERFNYLLGANARGASGQMDSIETPGDSSSSA